MTLRAALLRGISQLNFVSAKFDAFILIFYI